MKDKIALLMQETGCAQGEAELALELCGYEVEKAVAAIPRLFQNIAVLKGKLRDDGETLYGLLLVILNLRDRSLMRARAVVSYNPAVYTADIEQGWFEFEKHLYACRLWDGSLQGLSQDLEKLLVAYFASQDSSAFFAETKAAESRASQFLHDVLSQCFTPGRLSLVLRRDLLDMGQFQRIGTDSRRPHRGRARRPGPEGTLVLKIALEPQPDGLPAGELRAGDLVYAMITDTRDVAQYLARLFGPQDSGSLLVPVEAVETVPALESRPGGAEARPGLPAIGVRVRFSLGVCGDVNLPPDIRLKVVRRAAPTSWWRKIFPGGA